MNYTTETFLFTDLQNANLEKSWCYFYDKYAPLITRFAYRQGIPQVDSNDILQETMLELYTALPKFNYDPRKGKFRNFVLLITKRRCTRYLKKSHRFPASTDPVELDDQCCQDASDLLKDFDCCKGFSCEIIVDALKRLKDKKIISESSHAAYEKYAILNEDAAKVANELKMTLGQVYRIKNRLNPMLQAEILSGDEADAEMLESIFA